MENDKLIATPDRTTCPTCGVPLGAPNERNCPDPFHASALDKVAQGIAGLAPKEDKLLTITSKSLGEVLPAKFYEGASQLVLSEAERAILTRLKNTPDEDVEIRPDGLVYAEHIHARRSLTELFGAERELLPGSAIAQEKNGDRVDIFQRWVLTVRGRYIGEAIGCGTYWANNSKANKSDAAEGAQSEALRRICAKSALGIGSNVWDRRFAREWRREHAVEVWVKTSQGNKRHWRRNDDDPLEGEIGPVKQGEPGNAKGRGNADSARAEEAARTERKDQPVGNASETSSVVPAEPPQAEPKATEHPKPKAQPITSEPATPAAAAQEGKVEMVSGGNLRYLVGFLHRSNIISADDVKNGKRQATFEEEKSAIAFLCKATNRAFPESSEGALKKLFMTLTMDEFNKLVVPAVKAYANPSIANPSI